MGVVHRGLITSKKELLESYGWDASGLLDRSFGISYVGNLNTLGYKVCLWRYLSWLTYLMSSEQNAYPQGIVYVALLRNQFWDQDRLKHFTIESLRKINDAMSPSFGINAVRRVRVLVSYPVEPERFYYYYFGGYEIVEKPNERDIVFLAVKFSDPRAIQRNLIKGCLIASGERIGDFRIPVLATGTGSFVISACVDVLLGQVNSLHDSLIIHLGYSNKDITNAWPLITSYHPFLRQTVDENLLREVYKRLLSFNCEDFKQVIPFFRTDNSPVQYDWSVYKRFRVEKDLARLAAVNMCVSSALSSSKGDVAILLDVRKKGKQGQTSTLEIKLVDKDFKLEFSDTSSIDSVHFDNRISTCFSRVFTRFWRILSSVGSTRVFRIFFISFTSLRRVITSFSKRFIRFSKEPIRFSKESSRFSKESIRFSKEVTFIFITVVSSKLRARLIEMPLISSVNFSSMLCNFSPNIRKSLWSWLMRVPTCEAVKVSVAFLVGFLASIENILIRMIKLVKKTLYLSKFSPPVFAFILWLTIAEKVRMVDYIIWIVIYNYPVAGASMSEVFGPITRKGKDDNVGASPVKSYSVQKDIDGIILSSSPISPLNASGIVELQQLIRMEMMFKAYQEILSDYGRQTHSFVKSAIDKILMDNVGQELIERIKKTIALMPDPHHIDIEQDGKCNWFNWFELNNISREQYPVLGRGCKLPCLHCLRGNGIFLARCDPLPVVIEKMKKCYAVEDNRVVFRLYDRNDPFDWCDPFFGVYLDGIIEFALRLNPNMTFNVVTKGWDKNDKRAQCAAEYVAKIPSIRGIFALSFHLFLPSYYDVIGAMYRTKKHNVPVELIDIYAERFTNIISTLDRSLECIFLYIIDYPRTSLDMAITEVFRKVLDKIGVDSEIVRKAEVELKDYFGFSDLWGKKIESLSGIVDIKLGNIMRVGRGTDLLRRLEEANQGKESCLRMDTTEIQDYSYLESHCPYPELEISSLGKVVVYSKAGEVLFNSNLEEIEQPTNYNYHR